MTFKSILIAGVLLASTSLAQAADHVVTITGFSFVPATLTVAAGDTVTFINKDGSLHTATDRGNAFDTGRLSRNKQATITFASAGSFSYFCEVHPRMRGRIEVQ
jgi:plastocyanin